MILWPIRARVLFELFYKCFCEVICNGKSLLVITRFLDKRTIKKPISGTLVHLAELALTLNCLSFGDIFNKQPNGLSTGNKIGLSYGKHFVGFIEIKSIQRPHT